jgi:hypothetical protein
MIIILVVLLLLLSHNIFKMALPFSKLQSSSSQAISDGCWQGSSYV